MFAYVFDSTIPILDFAPNGAKASRVVLCYKHVAPLERRQKYAAWLERSRETLFHAQQLDVKH
jgi:hypothetical protein